MRPSLRLLTAGMLALSQPLWAAEDVLDFYKEEAKVVSASLRPQSAAQTPATVYTVTQQDIKNSGATTFWDALRNVPGLDVIQARTGQGEIGIRGLDRPYNNRVLILLDGRSVLEGYFDHLLSETLPITMDQIDRIEVVEGPASAVYGANAVSGVINIISKTPESLQGGRVTYTGGERSTQQGSVLYGKKDGSLGYRLNGGWRSTNRYENADSLASEAGLFNGLVSYDLSDHAGISLAGGMNNYNTLTSAGGFGTVNDKGITSFTRIDSHYKDTRVRAYWNGGRTVPQSLLVNGDLNYDEFDVTADQSLSLPFKNQAVLGSTYHRTAAQSAVLQDGSVHQDLWSVFFEDKWEMAQRWMLMVSGRVDRHPLTPIRFSPRGSLLYTPVPEQVFRISAGTSYRNPTLLENYLNSTVASPSLGVPVQFLGNRTLAPETLNSVEIAHTGRFQRLKTNVVGFYYRYKNSIDALTPSPIFTPIPVPPFFALTGVQAGFQNIEPVDAFGGELGGEYRITSGIVAFANYSYQYLRADSGNSYPGRISPRHKANSGLRTTHGGFTSGLEVHWVDSTFGQTGNADPAAYLGPVNAYFLVDAHLGYAFSGRLNGLELGVNAFNLLNHDHYEALPPQDINNNGQSGELIRSRFTGSVSYKF